MALTSVGLALLAALLLGPVPHLLAVARWPRREPRAALILWQATGLAAGLALLGAAVAMALAPLGGGLLGALGGVLARLWRGEPTAGLGPWHVGLLLASLMLAGWLVGVLAVRLSRMVWYRRRHRMIVDVVASPWPRARGGRLLDHPAATAYCLPGRAPRVVLTSGALALLDDEEITAVLAHERAHLSERHDLVVLPFSAWAAALPCFGTLRGARRAVAGLVEMVADDRACLVADRMALASALARVGVASSPVGALALSAPDGGAHAVVDRVRRLLDPPPRSLRLRLASYLTAGLMLVLPTVVLLVTA